MPDPVHLALVLTVTALVAAGPVLLAGWLGRGPAYRPTAAALVLAPVGALALGAWLLDAWPHWPPREDGDRLLLVIVPALAAVELFSALVQRPRLSWALRLALAVAAAPVLLHDTVYLADLAGSGSRRWSLGQAGLILGGVEIALVAEWALLTWVVERGGGQSVLLALALACLGAAAAVMLSGYATGGVLGVPAAGALIGAALGSALGGQAALQGPLGLGLVGLLGLLVGGHFFGELAAGPALLLGLSSLLCVVPEVVLRRAGASWRGAARVALAAGPVILTLVLVQRQLSTGSAPNTPAAAVEPSLQDYLDFRP